MRLFLFLLVFVGAVSLWGQTNLWPDGGFESSGVAGAARSGSKAGFLSTSEKVHWRHFGLRKLEVEPFATYELTAWIKGKMGAGKCTPLFSYSYNCYGWFNGGDNHLAYSEAADWTKISRRVISNRDVIEITPLTFLSSGPGDFWIDDMSMIKVLSAEETMKEIAARPKKSSQNRQLLMWYHFSRGEEAAAKAAISANDVREQAEYACLMAQRATTKEARRQYLVEMIKWNCMQFPDANKRQTELFAEYSAIERMAICAEGIKAYTGKNAKVLDCLKQVPKTRKMATKEDFDDELADNLHVLSELRALAAAKADLPWTPVLEEWAQRAANANQKREKWLAELGKCVIRLGGKQLSASEHVIVLPTEPTPSEQRAASELRERLMLQTGVNLEIVAESQTGARFPILLGRSSSFARYGVQVDYAHLGLDGIHIELLPNALVLAGGQRGVLYSMFTFLEEQLGWRWFTDHCIVWPKQGDFTPAPFKKVYVPKIAFRMPSSIQMTQPEICVPLKLVGQRVRADESWGGSFHFRPWVHTFNAMVPREKYAAEHPEYYSEINGKRFTEERTQLCLTNPEVLQISIDKVREWIRTASPGLFAVSISQNDWRNYCCCANCQALADHEGSQAGPLLHFVNKIAAAVEKDYPDLLIDTLAYQYTRKAPKFVKPAKNVLIRLCSIECCFVHTLEDCEYNQSFRDDIIDWARISPRLFVWDYTINFAHSTQPFPNLRVLKPNLQFYVEHGVTGMYEQGNAFTRGGEFQDLRVYLLAKLLWDQNFDVEQGIVDFTNHYYGPAAPHIRAYIELIHDTIGGDTDKHVRIYASPRSYLDRPEMLAKAQQIFAQADAAVSNDPVFAQRVSVACMPLWYTMLELGSTAFFLQDGVFKAGGAHDYQDILQRFVDAAKAVKLTKISESARRPYNAWLTFQQSRASQSKPLTLSNEHVEMIVLPEMGGRIWRLRQTGDSHDVLRVFGDDKNGYTLIEGGYEEYSTTDFQSPGWKEPYEVVEAGKTHLVLQASLPNMRQVTRRYELLADRPGFRVETKVRGSGNLAFRTHPLFTMSDPANTVLMSKDAAGKWNRRVLAVDGSDNIYLRDQECPAGEWGFLNVKTGQALINRFVPEQVDFCYAHSAPAEKRLNLEQWSKPGTGAVMMINEYEIIKNFKP